MKRELSKSEVYDLYQKDKALIDSIAQFVRAQMEYGSDYGLEGMIALGIHDAKQLS